MTTLSKSTACIGGIIATSSKFACYLKINAPSYVFQASIPPADAAIVDACLDLIQNDPKITKSLWKKTCYFRQKLIKAGFNLGKSKSPIIPVFIGDPKILRLMERDLFNAGIFAVSVTYPVVSASKTRFRFIINNSHTKKDIDNLIKILCNLKQKYNLISSNFEIN